MKTKPGPIATCGHCLWFYQTAVDSGTCADGEPHAVGDKACRFFFVYNNIEVQRGVE